MEILTTICFYLLGVIYAAMEGFREAQLWEAKNRIVRLLDAIENRYILKKKFDFVAEVELNNNKELHDDYGISRALFGIAFFFATDWIITLAMCLSFPFFHLGTMYQERNKLNPKVYLKGFKSDNSMTGTQKIKLFKTAFKTYNSRLIIFILSLILLCYKIFIT